MCTAGRDPTSRSILWGRGSGVQEGAGVTELPAERAVTQR